jgi:hypothetical protein
MKSTKWTRWMKGAAAAAGLAGIVAALPVRAADTISVPVSATVLGVCKFATGQTPSVVIANSGTNIDPSVAGNATGSANITYSCTNGTTPSFGLTGGATLTLTCSTSGTCGSSTMAAAMTLTPPAPATGQGMNTNLTLVLTGTIPSTTYGTAAEGTYSATQQVTINP